MLLCVQLVGVKRWSWWSKLLSKHPRISLIVPSMPVSGRTSEPRGQWRRDPAQKSTLHSSIAPQVGDDDHDDNLPENFFISPKFLVSVIIKVFLLCKHLYDHDDYGDGDDECYKAAPSATIGQRF